jgi:hypothetical protein
LKADRSGGRPRFAAQNKALEHVDAIAGDVNVNITNLQGVFLEGLVAHHHQQAAFDQVVRGPAHFGFARRLKFEIHLFDEFTKVVSVVETRIDLEGIDETIGILNERGIGCVQDTQAQFLLAVDHLLHLLIIPKLDTFKLDTFKLDSTRLTLKISSNFDRFEALFENAVRCRPNLGSGHVLTQEAIVRKPYLKLQTRI